MIPGPTAVATIVLLALALAAVPHWLPKIPQSLRRDSRRVVTLAVGVVGLAVAVVLGGLLPADAPGRLWRWATFAVASAASLLAGGAVTTSVLALADRPRPTAGDSRVQRVVLRGGAWIGALERVAVTATLLAGWPEGVAVIVAIKGLARYPELKTPDTGAGERFIIGTFASVSWAAACAGVALIIVG